MSNKPWIHCWADEQNQYCAVFSLLLTNIVLDRRQTDDTVLRNYNKQVNFINALHRTDEKHTLALRYIVIPGDGGILAGNIKAVLLGKTMAPDENTARQEAVAYCEEISALISGAMPDASWRIVDDVDTFNSLWKPFDLEQAHVAEITRREQELRLETLSQRPSLGKNRHQSPDWNNQNNLYLVNGFRLRDGFSTELFQTLRAFQIPLIWQVSLSPSMLTEEEENALLKESACCEKYLGSVAVSSIPKTQAHHATMVLNRLMKQLAVLSDAPFLLNIMAASPCPLPNSLLECIGVEITLAATMNEDGGAGGYDIFRPETEAQKALARQNIATLDFRPWSRQYAPPPLKRLRSLVDAVEAATAFRLPFAPPGGLPGFNTQAARNQPLSRDMAALSKDKTRRNKLFLGENDYLGHVTPVLMENRDRLQHMYVMGQTGTGKTTFLKSMILSDIHAGRGVAVIDPHGDLFEDILGLIPPSRWEDVVVFDPTDKEYPVGLNMLECKTDEQRHFVVREMRAIMERMMADQYGAVSREFTGPVFYQHMQMNMLLAMSDPDDPGSLLEFYEIFQHKDYWKRWLPLKWQDPMLVRWVENNLRSMDYTERFEGTTLGEYLSSKFDDFIFDPLLRNIFGQKNSLDIETVMNEGRILLVNLAKGALTESNARFLGMLLMAKIQNAAMERGQLPVDERRPFFLYVDEFQNLATRNFSLMLSEARKFGLGLVLANQFISQIEDKSIVRAIFGNVGTQVCFRAGMEDAEIMMPRFAPHFDAFDLANQPNWSAAVLAMNGGRIMPPFTLNTVLARGKPSVDTAFEVRKRSRKRYATPVKEVRRVIARSLNPPMALEPKT